MKTPSTWNMGIGAIVGVALFAAAGAAHATAFDFRIDFDGTTATQGAGSDPIVGTSLVPGDSFTLNIRAAGSDFWRVNSTALGIFPATFSLLESALRTSNITTTLFLDGVQVQQEVALGTVQQLVHIGGQTFNFVSGTEFDQLTVELDFLSISGSSANSTIRSSPDLVFFQQFFRQSYVDYIGGGGPAIAEPASLALLGAGLLGLAALRRRRAA
jgi:PEP-CTERM motif